MRQDSLSHEEEEERKEEERKEEDGDRMCGMSG
jgi:hypothetical protein